MPPKTSPRPRRELGELLLDRGSDGLPLHLVASKDDASLKDLTQAQRAWIEARGWQPKAGSVLLLSDDKGALAGALLGVGGEDWAAQSPLLPGALPGALPAGDYRVAGKLPDSELATLAWLAGCYRFGRYRSESNGKPKRLVLPDGVDRARVLALAEALYLGRDLINTPANDLGPAELEATARELATEHGAEGICFDTGGLDIKPGSAMALMKKDMGGAATALTLAHLIMSRKLPVRLRVLIPAADNSIAGNAFRPGDVLKSRNGITVEVGNTDAEGRLVLADALSLADEEAPDYLITIATLTGAARVALGPDLPPLFSNDEDFAADLLASSFKVGDPLWRLPFWEPYDKLLKSSIADVNHIAEGSHAGSVMAALFLKRFVTKAKRFAHLDIFGWVPREQPGRPQGGEPQAARALFAYFEKELGP
jgi:leucyl aminopeptidase